MSVVTVSILHKDELASAEKIWRKLEAQEQNTGLTNSWEWVQSWLACFGDTIDYWFVVGKSKNQTVGIALLTKEMQRRLPLPVSAYHVGTGGEPLKDMIRAIDNKILVKENSKKAFYEAFITLLINHFPWEEIIFTDFNHDQAKTVLETIKKKKLNFATETTPTLSYDFQQARDKQSTVLNTLSSETRYTIKRSTKVFENDLTTEWAETKEQAFNILDELIVLYESTWRKLGKRSVFDSVRFNQFQQLVIPSLIENKKAILFRVKSKTYGTLGCLYLLTDNGVAYGYQLGLNHFEDSEFQTINKKRLRIGFILHTLCMEECLKRGLKEYNFSEGLHRYKKELTNKQSQFVSISVQKNSKPKLRNAIFKLYGKLTEKKKTPAIIQMTTNFIRNRMLGVLLLPIRPYEI